MKNTNENMTQLQLSNIGRIAIIIFIAITLILQLWIHFDVKNIFLLSTLKYFFALILILINFCYFKTYQFFKIHFLLGSIRILNALAIFFFMILDFPFISLPGNIRFNSALICLFVEILTTAITNFGFYNAFIYKYHIQPRYILLASLILTNLLGNWISILSILYLGFCEYTLFYKLATMQFDSQVNEEFIDLKE